jgi:SAM-dependent methyltransferase
MMTDEPGEGIGSEVWQDHLDAAERDRLTRILERQAGDPFLRRVAARSIELMVLRQGDRILELGCGSGVLLPPLAEAASDSTVVGVDYSTEMLQEARRRVFEQELSEQVSVVKCIASDLPFGDSIFDAAHVERVLMHLEDPDSAICEMRRVVRPGGWVVAAEPDTLGIRIDHPLDPEAMTMIAMRDVSSVRNPGIGLELNRRFAIAGLVDRRVEALTDFDPNYDPTAASGDRAAASELVAQGTLDADRAEAAIAYLQQAAAEGTYAWLGTMVVAVGRVPGCG